MTPWDVVGLALLLWIGAAVLFCITRWIEQKYYGKSTAWDIINLELDIDNVYRLDADNKDLKKDKK